MSWASRRKAAYTLGTVLFFAIPTAIIAFVVAYKPPTCDDNVQNQGEHAVDRGGPCVLLDERALTPHAVVWARAFPIRDGAYAAAAYIENPNQGAGVEEAYYRIRLYDAKNVLVAEREGSTTIMPGAITPVFEANINTGSRVVARTFFEFAAPLVWERIEDTSRAVEVGNKTVEAAATAPRITARAISTEPRDLTDVRFVAVAFDAAGNAFAASQTVVPLFNAKATESLIFTWPDPFPKQPARIDVIPVISPRL